MPASGFLRAVGVAMIIFVFLSCARAEDADTLSGGQSPSDAVTEDDAGVFILASFNIRILSDRSRTDEELAHISDLVAAYDLIAIQEARDPDVLDRLVRMLEARHRKSYSYTSTDPIGRGTKELYVWLYRTDFLEPIGDPAVYPDTQDIFIREPAAQAFHFFGRGFVGSPGFDGALINMHAVYGDTVAERRKEVAHLFEVISWARDSFLDSVFGIGTTESDIILLGDFNLPSKDDAFDSLRIGGLKSVNDHALPTTIYDNSYDNIWFDPRYTDEILDEWGIERFDETRFDNDDAYASLTVSDHRPIWVKINGAGDDD